jgi:hypothetical protein
VEIVDWKVQVPAIGVDLSGQRPIAKMGSDLSGQWVRGQRGQIDAKDHGARHDLRGREEGVPAGRLALSTRSPADTVDDRVARAAHWMH